MTEYPNGDKPTGGNPVCSGIPDQGWTQNVAISAFNVAGYCFDSQALTFSQTGLPGGTGIALSSAGVFTGTPTASDVGANDVTVTATDTDTNTGSDIFRATTTAVAGGDVFTIPDVGSSTATVFDGDTTNGAAGASWASIRTSGTGTTVGPGDTLIIAAGERGTTEFRDMLGTEALPITIRNATSGQVTIASSAQDALLCRHCRYVDIDGTAGWTGNTGGCGYQPGDAAARTHCGIKVDSTGQFGVHLRGERRFVRIMGVEVNGNWPGTVSDTGTDVAISWNDQAYCASAHGWDIADKGYDPEHPTDNPNGEWAEGLVLSDSYLHDVAHEIGYLGPNINQSCGGNQGNVLRQRNVTVENNWMEDGGWDGMNLKSAISGTNTVRYNRIRAIGGGTVVSGAESVGVSVYESHAEVYNNVISGMSNPPGEGHGIKIILDHMPSTWGTQTTTVYTNVIYEVDGHGIQVTKDAAAPAMQVNIHNNTVVEAARYCVNYNLNSSLSGTIRDNILAGCTDGPTNYPSPVTASNNRSGARTAQGFTDQANDDFSLTSGSGAKNQDTTGCPTPDVFGITRPQGGNCDQGAHEFDE